MNKKHKYAEYWINVYEDGLGTPRKSKVEAQCAGANTTQFRRLLYRIHVRLK